MLKIVENYTLTDYLGKGEYGKVYKAVNLDTKIDVAIKMIPLRKFQEVSKLAQLTRNEIQMIKLIEDNINIIRFVEMIKTNRFIYLVYEYCEGGTLEDLIVKRGRIPERDALLIFRQLINAFKSLHDWNILHRDVKTNNIFFKSGHLKLADFGFCKKLKNKDDLTQTSLGSPLYMAPEIMNGDVYGSKADIWSCGIVLFEMLFGYCPFSQCSIADLVTMNANDKHAVPIPSDKWPITPVTEGMLRRMLEKDQFKRISWQDFFYEYEISQHGTINRKEKDFQYDLMKLMKKNSVNTTLKRKESIPFKFDWSKITQLNSSVHSEELNPDGNLAQENGIDNFYSLKRKLKEFENEHTKMVEVSKIIESMLNSGKQYQYSNAMLYFLIYNLSHILKSTQSNITQFGLENKDLLNEHPKESNSLNKLQVVFGNEHKTLSLKLNSIKSLLLAEGEFSRDIFKYPQNGVLRTYLQLFVNNYEKEVPGCTSFDTEAREECLYLLRVLWGVNQIRQQKDKKIKDLLLISSETTNKEVSAMLNKLLISMGI